MKQLAMASLLIAILASLSLAQEGKSRLTVDMVMTPDQTRAAGIAFLTPAQRAGLDKWLNEYTAESFGLLDTRRAASMATLAVGIG